MMNDIAIPDEVILSKVYFIRGCKVMPDSDLASLYGVETKVLKQAVKRNIKRFPDDFMFELTKDENNSLRSQFVTLKRGQHSKYLPYAFTEQGVVMLSSVLNSDRAIMVNIQIMRIFTRIREMLTDNLSVQLEIEEIKKKLSNQDKDIELVFSYLDELIEKHENPKPRRQIGFQIEKGETPSKSIPQRET